MSDPVPEAALACQLAEPLDPLPSDLREKLALTALLCLWTFGGYFLIGLSYDATRGHSLMTPLDEAIPFVPAFMWAYEAVYTFLLLPMFVVRCQRLFRRVAWAYFWVATLSLAVWAIYPVTAIGLRPDVTNMATDSFHAWGLRVNYALDPPLNLFPSLHVAIATLATLCAAKARPLWGALAAIGALAITLAVVFVKQHFVADALGGVILAAVCYRGAVASYPSDAPRDEVAYGWRGPASYLALHLGVVALFGAAYLLDWRPFPE